MKLLTKDLLVPATKTASLCRDWTPAELTARLLFDCLTVLLSIRRIGLFFIWMAIIGFIGTLIAISAAH